MLILAYVIVVPGIRILFSTRSSFEALAPGDCTESDKTRKIDDFNKTIVLYGMKMRTSSVKNDLYAPDDAMKQFKKYLACKKEGLFTAAELKQYDDGIMKNGKAVYGYYAEDICAEMKAAASGTKKEQDDIRDKYSDLVDDYYTTFNENFARPKDCNM